MNWSRGWGLFFVVFIPVVTLILSYFVDLRFLSLLSVYGIISLLKLFLEMWYSGENNKVEWPESPDFVPKVSVVVPSYNEDYESLLYCVRSIAVQDYKNFDVYLVDDGSLHHNAERVYEYIKAEFPKLKIIFTKFVQNRGKRCAQKWAFDQSKADVFVTVDSDTTIERDGLWRITRPFAAERVGAVTGDSSVINRTENLLTRLIDVRYWFAFNIERASQSYFGCVMCCSGVFSAYRGNLIRKLKDRYVSQAFLGHACNFGDDRHLTNLILNEGYGVYFYNRARASTIVPETMGKWLKQQLRWNKSFYREILWNIPSIPKHHIFMAWELVLQAVLPFFLLINIGLFFWKGVSVGMNYFVLWLILMLCMGVIRTIWAVLNYKGKNVEKFCLFPLYAFLHVFILIPVRIVAIVTLGRNGWGTR